MGGAIVGFKKHPCRSIHDDEARKGWEGGLLSRAPPLRTCTRSSSPGLCVDCSLVPRDVVWTEIQVQTDARAGEMIMNVWPGASRARKRSPNPKDGRARLEAVAAWPEEPRLQRREHYDESQAVESRFYVLVGKAEELKNQGEHRAASEVRKQADRLWPAVYAIQMHNEEMFFARLPDDVVRYEKNQLALLRALSREARALRQQGKVQAFDKIKQRIDQLIDEDDARTRKQLELLGDHEGLLLLKDREARLPLGTTSRLERAYRAPPPTDVGLRKGWKNSIVSLAFQRQRRPPRKPPQRRRRRCRK